MRVPLAFPVADLSATCNSQWVARPSGSSRGSVGIGWPATGTPVGTITIEVADTPTATTGATLATATTNPAGTAAGTVIDFGPTAAPYARVKYTVTSGGIGATFRNSNQVANSTASLTWGAT